MGRGLARRQVAPPWAGLDAEFAPRTARDPPAPDHGRGNQVHEPPQRRTPDRGRPPGHSVLLLVPTAVGADHGGAHGIRLFHDRTALIIDAEIRMAGGSSA